MVDYDIEKSISALEEAGLHIRPPKRWHIKLDRAEELILAAGKTITDGSFIMTSDYADIAKWLSDNNQLGLLMMGPCGNGKTLMGEHILPTILHATYGVVVRPYSAQQMNAMADKLIDSSSPIFIDDIGTEDALVEYGSKRMIFSEIVNAAEKNGRLLIVSTNLSPSEMEEKYGKRTMSRLRGTTKLVSLRHADFRHNT